MEKFSVPLNSISTWKNFLFENFTFLPFFDYVIIELFITKADFWCFTIIKRDFSCRFLPNFDRFSANFS
jgi:hypothetical protein